MDRALAKEKSMMIMDQRHDEQTCAGVSVPRDALFDSQYVNFTLSEGVSTTFPHFHQLLMRSGIFARHVVHYDRYLGPQAEQLEEICVSETPQSKHHEII